MRLIDYYREDIARLPVKVAQARRRHWHEAAKRFLYFASITSDPIPPLHTDSDGTTTVPFWQFWIKRDVDELIELYRVTKRKRTSAD